MEAQNAVMDGTRLLPTPASRAELTVASSAALYDRKIGSVLPLPAASGRRSVQRPGCAFGFTWSDQAMYSSSSRRSPGMRRSCASASASI